MPTPSQVLAAHQSSVLRVRAGLVDYSALLWKAQPGFRDANVAEFTRFIVPRVQAAQIRTASLTSAYLSQMANAKYGVKSATVPVNRQAVVSGRGVDPVEVYTRPAVTVRTALSEGKPYTEAVAAGLTRLTSLVTTDLQMAKVRQVSSSTRGSRFQYFARVLTGAEDCALCVIASTQRYTRGDLMPIHPGCDCGVEPLQSERDPGQVLDQALLDRTHELVTQKVGFSDSGARNLGIGKYDSQGKPISDYTELIITRDHGEYGPTLSWRSDKFTGSKDI